MRENIKAKNKVKSCVFTFPIKYVEVINGIPYNKKGYKIDLKSKLDIPITFNPVLDETLNTAQIVLSDFKQKDIIDNAVLNVSTAFEPGVRVDIIFEDEDGEEQETAIHMMIAQDICKLQRKDNTQWKSYKHTIQLVELTKELERLSVDTLTFTNPVPRVYDAEADANWSFV